MIIEKENQRGTKYYVSTNGEIVSKVCGTCQENKKLEEYYRQRGRLGDRKANCKKCHSVKSKDRYKNNAEYRGRILKQSNRWAKENKQRHNDVNARWVESNRKKHNKCVREWQLNNKPKMRVYMNNYIARKKGLVNNLSENEWTSILDRFNNKCALTGNATNNIHADHVIPASIGHGGTVYGNMIPLRADLNISKSNRNIFEWFYDNRERFGLSQRKFDELIEYLADINEMTVEEYRDYVYWCHDNPRTVDEIKQEETNDEEAS